MKKTRCLKMQKRKKIRRRMSRRRREMLRVTKKKEKEVTREMEVGQQRKVDHQRKRRSTTIEKFLSWSRSLLLIMQKLNDNEVEERTQRLVPFVLLLLSLFLPKNIDSELVLLFCMYKKLLCDTLLYELSLS